MDNIDYRTITFKECARHKGLLFACEPCPVCAIEEDLDVALGRAEYERTQLEGYIEDLENRLCQYEDLENRLCQYEIT